MQETTSVKTLNIFIPNSAGKTSSLNTKHLYHSIRVISIRDDVQNTSSHVEIFLPHYTYTVIQQKACIYYALQLCAYFQ